MQVSLSSSPIELQISQGIKQQLSTMMLYLARFDSKKVAELSQRFSQPDRDADASRRSSRTTKKSSGHSRVGSRNSLADSHSSPMTRQMSGLPTSRLSKDMTGSRLGRSATSHDRSAAGHDTDTSRSDGKAQTVSSEVDEDEKVSDLSHIHKLRALGYSPADCHAPHCMLSALSPSCQQKRAFW